MSPRINLLLVIQHVEPYKYINMYLDYFDTFIPCSLVRFTPAASTYSILFSSTLERKTYRVTGAPNISLERITKDSKIKKLELTKIIFYHKWDWNSLQIIISNAFLFLYKSFSFWFLFYIYHPEGPTSMFTV